MVKVRPVNERLYYKSEESNTYPTRLNQFAEKYNVPNYMAELFLNEARLDKGNKNDHIKYTAKILRLM